MYSYLIIGYSGHAFVVLDTMQLNSMEILGYCETTEKLKNPYDLQYLGPENPSLLSSNKWLVGIGDNKIREKIIDSNNDKNLISVIHPTAFISEHASIGLGSFVNANVAINALSKIGKGCILNTGSILEHECILSDFVHIAPGATLAGNVIVGKRSFIGANAVVRQGVTIGSDVTVGAGSVIIRDIESGSKVVGNPSRKIE